MVQIIYHGDPDREHRFWVYPKYKLLQNSQWDAYDPHDLCDDFTLLDKYHCGDTQTYQCNGHPNEWYGCLECLYLGLYEQIITRPKFYHGHASGDDHHFWVYPKGKKLITPEWDVYDPTHLCDNFSALDIDQATGVQTYKCNGHENEWLYPDIHRNVITRPKLYHGHASGDDHHFWVYPEHKKLITPEWDVYDPTHLCDHFSALDIDQATGVQTYKCNGH